MSDRWTRLSDRHDIEFLSCRLRQDLPSAKIANEAELIYTADVELAAEKGEYRCNELVERPLTLPVCTRIQGPYDCARPAGVAHYLIEYFLISNDQLLGCNLPVPGSGTRNLLVHSVR